MPRSAVIPRILLIGSLLGLASGCTGSAGGDSRGAEASLSSLPPSDVELSLPSNTGTAAVSADVVSTPALTVLPAGTVAENLDVPWGIGLLPDGSALVTERDSGKIKQINLFTASDVPSPTIEIGTVAGVIPQGEGGLLGLAISPTFETDRLVFVYFTGADGNQVDRLTLIDDALTNQQPILTGIPAGGTHNGGRIVFGPDGNLYIGTGDAGQQENAQDLGSLGGKILRVAADGTAPSGNPFPDAPLVFSLGHRNVQGITFDEAGRVWAAEFGPSSVDELNLIVPGNNYGWPVVEGIANTAPYTDPEQVWRTSEASPSGIAFARGSLWMAGLRGETLWEIKVLADGTTQTPLPHLDAEYGRLRTVLLAPDKSLWVSTSNTDGRGDPVDQDDRILRFTLT